MFYFTLLPKDTNCWYSTFRNRRCLHHHGSKCKVNNIYTVVFDTNCSKRSYSTSHGQGKLLCNIDNYLPTNKASTTSNKASMFSSSRSRNVRSRNYQCARSQQLILKPMQNYSIRLTRSQVLVLRELSYFSTVFPSVH